MIAKMLLATAFAILQLVSATSKKYTLPEGDGPYGVSLNVRELDDHSRQDPYNSSHIRRVMISRFDPQDKVACKEIHKIPYFSPVVAKAEVAIQGAFDFPNIWSDFELPVCAPTAVPTQEFPIALFSPGFNTSRLFYSSLAMQIASHGYTVITIDHPYDADIVQFPNGDIIYGGVIPIPDNPGINDPAVVKALDVRAEDVQFILNALNIQCDVVMFGHSFGGAAAGTAMRKDNRIRGGINIDGSMFGPVVTHGITSPEGRSFVLWGSTGHNSSSPDDPTWGDFWSSIKRERMLWKREMSILNSTHNSYWDVNLMVDLAGVRNELDSIAQQLVSPIHGRRVYQILGQYLPAFFKFALGGPESPLYEHPSKEFPEVEILN